MLKCGIFACNYLYIHSVWILHTNCTQNFWCTIFVDQNWFIKTVYKRYVYKMYTKFRQTFVYILYTKFSCHSCLNFVYKMYTEDCRFNFAYKMYTKVCWKVVYILYTSVAYILYNFCIQDVCKISVWVVLLKMCSSNDSLFALIY